MNSCDEPTAKVVRQNIILTGGKFHDEELKAKVTQIIGRKIGQSKIICDNLLYGPVQGGITLAASPSFRVEEYRNFTTMNLREREHPSIFYQAVLRTSYYWGRSLKTLQATDIPYEAEPTRDFY